MGSSLRRRAARRRHQSAPTRNGKFAAECATLTLPVDWSHPGGPTFGLAVARHPATDPAHRIGTLIFGPGGPGDSGVDRIVNKLGRFSPDLQEHFDIVSFDPRGVGGSSPLSCSPGLLAQAPSPVLTSQADFDATLDYNRRLWADCRARTGPVFDHADTASTVRDLDALRAALGEQTLTFQGHVVRHAARRAVRRALPRPGAGDRAGERRRPPPDRHLGVPGRAVVGAAGLVRRVRGLVRRADHHHVRATRARRAGCLGWPRVANPQQTLDVHTKTPVLLINARHDAATGINWAASVEHQLGRDGVLVVYPGVGHGVYSLSACLRQVIDAYLISLKVPPRGTECA